MRGFFRMRCFILTYCSFKCRGELAVTQISSIAGFGRFFRCSYMFGVYLSNFVVAKIEKRLFIGSLNADKI